MSESEIAVIEKMLKALDRAEYDLLSLQVEAGSIGRFSPSTDKALAMIRDAVESAKATFNLTTAPKSA